MAANHSPALVLAAGLALAFLASGTGPAAAGATLDRIVAAKTIRMGVRVDAPPFASLVDGKPAGFSVDLCGLIAGAVLVTSNLTELTGTFVEVSGEDRFEKLAAGEIDMLCGATTATLTRRETMSFSIPTFSTGVGALVNKNAPESLRAVLIDGGEAAVSGPAVAEALRGRTVGVRAGTTAEDWLKTSPLAKVEGLKIIAAKDHRAGVGAVAAGTIDAYFGDQAILIGQRAAAQRSADLLLSRYTFTKEPYALALPRNDEDLRLIIDRALSYIYRTGAIYNVFARHFGEPSAEVLLFYSIVSLPE